SAGASCGSLFVVPFLHSSLVIKFLPVFLQSGLDFLFAGFGIPMHRRCASGNEVIKGTAVNASEFTAVFHLYRIGIFANRKP
ncbi:MAG: hypothetical protein ACOYI5_10595, partial [Christensenellales bacterium]